MTTQARCAACGRERPAVSPPAGPCPFCLLQLGLETPSGPDSPWLDPDTWSGRILNILGVEDMTTSYLAEQASPASRLVVITQLDRKLTTDDERSQATAVLSRLMSFTHPVVTAVYGGLLSQEGVVRLVSEHVPGAPIDRYCARAGAGEHERAMLCASVAEAIHAAHEHGLAHGRLCPRRVLITTRSGRARPIVTGLGFALMAGEAGDPPSDAVALAELARTLGLDVPEGPWQTARDLADRLRRLA